MSDEVIKNEDNNVAIPEMEIPKTEEAVKEASVETVEQKIEPVGEEIQPPNPLVRVNESPTPVVVSTQSPQSSQVSSITPDTSIITTSSPLDAVALAFKTNMMRARELLIKARMAIQIKKQKKLEKIMNLFLTKKKIDNSDVRDLLHIADGTATGYLNILKKEGKIEQNGKGKAIYYIKI